MTLEWFSFGNLTMFDLEVLCQHSLRGLTTFQPSGAALWDGDKRELPCYGWSCAGGEKEAGVTAVSNLPRWQRGEAEPQAVGKGICCFCRAREL